MSHITQRSRCSAVPSFKVVSARQRSTVCTVKDTFILPFRGHMLPNTNHDTINKDATLSLTGVGGLVPKAGLGAGVFSVGNGVPAPGGVGRPAKGVGANVLLVPAEAVATVSRRMEALNFMVIDGVLIG